MSAPFFKRILTILTCPFWQAIYKGDAPLLLHLFTSVLTLSNSFSTMSKCPFWQAIYKGDAPLSVHLFTSVLTLSNSFSTMSKCPFWQAIYKGDAPLLLHLFTSVLTLSNSFIQCLNVHYGKLHIKVMYLRPYTCLHLF